MHESGEHWIGQKKEKWLFRELHKSLANQAEGLDDDIVDPSLSLAREASCNFLAIDIELEHCAKWRLFAIRIRTIKTA